jgi:hypothetical protein
MARAKYDGIVQAVRYGEDGEILWVRAFLRRGPTWSDSVLIDRKTLVDKLKSGKQFVIGKRVNCSSTLSFPLFYGLSEISAGSGHGEPGEEKGTVARARIITTLQHLFTT